MFKREFVETSDKGWEKAEEMNQWLSDLGALKLNEVRVEGSLIKSKVAWKIAVLSQAYLYRLHELGESCAIAWNNQHYIASLTLARSIIETGVVFCDFDENIKRGLEQKNLDFLNDSVMKKTFSTRIEELVGDEENFKATNILTFIKKKESEIPGLEALYHNLSDCAHPNQFGHFQHYGDLDHSNGTVTFTNGKFLKAKFQSIVCAFFLIELGFHAHKRIQENIEKVSELQHQINPVPT